MDGSELDLRLEGESAPGGTTRLLVVEDATAEFVFRDIHARNNFV